MLLFSTEILVRGQRLWFYQSHVVGLFLLTRVIGPGDYDARSDLSRTVTAIENRLLPVQMNPAAQNMGTSSLQEAIQNLGFCCAVSRYVRGHDCSLILCFYHRR
jgi:hypothetical protein